MTIEKQSLQKETRDINEIIWITYQNATTIKHYREFYEVDSKSN